MTQGSEPETGWSDTIHPSITIFIMLAKSPSDKNRESPHHWAVIALFFAALSIGFSPIFVRLTDVGPIAAAFYRTALSLPFLFAWATFDDRAQHATPPAAFSVGDWALIAIGGIGFAADLGFWHVSIGLTSVSNATLFANMAPIFVTLGGAVFFGNRVTPAFLLSLAGALTGAWVLAGGVAGVASGDLLALVAAFFYGTYMLVLSRLSRRFTTARVLTYLSLISSLCLLPTAALHGETLLPSGLYGWSVLIGLALISQVAGQSLIAYGLRHLPAAFSSLSLLLQPVFAGLIAAFLFDEPILARQIIGGGIILASIIAARLRG